MPRRLIGPGIFLVSRKLAHSNRGLHNWLIYQINDRCLVEHQHLFKGCLYDLGAGESPYRNFFLERADKHVAVDWAGTFHNSKADIVADLNLPLPIENEVADSIVSLSVMEHLCEPQCMLNEAYRILKPLGNMVLQVPWQWHIHEQPYDFFRYTPFALKYMLNKAGFTEIVVKPQSGFFTMWLLKINYFSLRLIRGPRFMRTVIKAILTPIWFINQTAAPWLDRFDRNWSAESTGFIVSARKPVDHG
jgi:SAM-dependent methyltransferase